MLDRESRVGVCGLWVVSGKLLRGFAAWIGFSKYGAGLGVGDESPTYWWRRESWRRILRSHPFVRCGERMDGAQMCGGWFAKGECRSPFDSSHSRHAQDDRAVILPDRLARRLLSARRLDSIGAGGARRAMPMRSS